MHGLTNWICDRGESRFDNISPSRLREGLGEGLNIARSSKLRALSRPLPQAGGEKGRHMTKSFEFLFDFGGPNSYLAHKVLPKYCAANDAEAVYVPILLGGLFKATNNQAPLIRYAETPAKRNYEMLEFDRFVKAHAIPFTMNPNFPINSLLLMRGAVAAQHLGCFMPYVEAIMAAMWEEGANTGDAAVVRDVLDKAGLDGAALLAKAGDPEIKAELVANTEKAAERGAFGVPTFFVGGEMFWGQGTAGASSRGACQIIILRGH